MHSLFEKQENLNAPIETFLFDTEKMPFPVKAHWHYYAEFIYVLEGSAKITCDGKTTIVAPKELMLFPPSSIHSVFPTENGLKLFAGIKFDTAHFSDTSSYAPSVSNIFKYARSKDMANHFSEEEARALHCPEIFADCMEESSVYQYGQDIMLRAQIYRLIFGIVRKWLSMGLDLSGCPINSSDLYGIENIAEYIDSRLEDNIRVYEIAEKCNMSYSGFAAKFHEQYGMSCKDYIEKMRIFKAEEYLLFTDHDLTFISQKTGFSDCSHFIRCFKKHRGLTPVFFCIPKTTRERSGSKKLKR